VASVQRKYILVVFRLVVVATATSYFKRWERERDTQRLEMHNPLIGVSEGPRIKAIWICLASPIGVVFFIKLVFHCFFFFWIRSFSQFWINYGFWFNMRETEKERHRIQTRTFAIPEYFSSIEQKYLNYGRLD
jgi:hypothetical protein